MLDIISQPAVMGFGAVCAAIGILLCYIFVKKELSEVKQLRVRQKVLANEIDSLKKNLHEEQNITSANSTERDQLKKTNEDLTAKAKNLQTTINELQTDAGKSKELADQVKLLKRKVPESALRNIKGVGAVVEEKLKAAGITNVVDIAEMSEEELDRILDEAQVPNAARKHDIRGQAIALAEAI